MWRLAPFPGRNRFLFYRDCIKCRRKAGIGIASDGGVICGDFIVKSPEVDILGGHVNIRVITFRQDKSICPVRSHTDQLGGIAVFLVIDKTVSHIKTIHSVIGQHSTTFCDKE